MKVLHRAATSGAGGVERYVINHYKYIDREKIKFEFITRNVKLNDVQDIQDLSMKVHVFTATERENKEKLVKEIEGILEEGFDVLHMNTSSWAGFLIEELAMQRKIPKIIVHSHSTGIDMHSAEKRRYYQDMHEYFKLRFGKQHATHFCACCKEAADWMFGSQIPREEIRILKNAIEVEKYRYNEEIRKRIRDELGVEDNFVVGNVGRFAFQKNQLFLLRVFKQVYKSNPNSRLLLIGQGELQEEIIRYIEESGLKEVVILAGWREDVNLLMQAMDLFVLPSRFEGLPVSLIEAQTAGLKCLASDVITKEVIITKNIKMLPLEEKNWEREILSYMQGYDRKDTSGIVTEAGYNIQYAVKELESLYLE